MFKGFVNTFYIPLSKHFSISFYPLKAVKPIIGMFGIILEFIIPLILFVAYHPSKIGI